MLNGDINFGLEILFIHQRIICYYIIGYVLYDYDRQITYPTGNIGPYYEYKTSLYSHSNLNNVSSSSIKKVDENNLPNIIGMDYYYKSSGKINNLFQKFKTLQ